MAVPAAMSVAARGGGGARSGGEATSRAGGSGYLQSSL